MPKSFDVVSFLSSDAMAAREAETYSETYVIDRRNCGKLSGSQEGASRVRCGRLPDAGSPPARSNSVLRTAVRLKFREATLTH
jgi:hypothetical protein